MQTGQLVVSPRQRRLLRAVLPIGVVLLVLWIAWTALLAVTGSGEGWWSLSGLMGLVTSLVLIVTGYGYRKVLAR